MIACVGSAHGWMGKGPGGESRGSSTASSHPAVEDSVLHTTTRNLAKSAEINFRSKNHSSLQTLAPCTVPTSAIAPTLASALCVHHVRSQSSRWPSAGCQSSRSAQKLRDMPQKQQQVSQSVPIFQVSQSVVKQIGAAPIFTRCGRATLTPVLEYLVTEPPLKSDGTPRYAAPAAKVMLSMDPRWYSTRLMHIHQQGGYEDEKCNTIQLQ
jgi:hypothetical protein